MVFILEAEMSKRSIVIEATSCADCPLKNIEDGYYRCYTGQTLHLMVGNKSFVSEKQFAPFCPMQEQGETSV